VGSYLATPFYRASVMLRIDPEYVKVLPYEDSSRPSATFMAEESYLITQKETLQSRVLARRVIDNQEIQDDPAFEAQPRAGFIGSLKAMIGKGTESPEDSFISNLEVDWVGKSRLLKIDYVSHEAAFAAKAANALAQEFLDQDLERNEQGNLKAAEFLSDRLKEIKSRVEELKVALLEYTRSNPMLELEEGAAIQQRLAEIYQRMGEAEARLITSSAELAAVREASVDTFPSSLKGEVINSLEVKLLELKQQLANLSGWYDEAWPEVSQVKQEILETEEQLIAEKKRILQETMEQARLDYKVAAAEREQLKGSLKDESAVANRYREASIDYTLLRNEAATAEQLHDSIMQRLEEVRVAKGLIVSNIHVVEWAMPPNSPYWPNKTLIVLVGLLFGLVGGIGLCFAADRLVQTITEPDEVVRILRVPYLGSVPTLTPSTGKHSQPITLLGQNRAENGDRRRRFQRPSEPQLLPSADTGSQAWEAYRSLLIPMLLKDPKSPKRILITSALPGEGKTTSAVNLGRVLATSGVRTLLLDLDRCSMPLVEALGIIDTRAAGTYLADNIDKISLGPGARTFWNIRETPESGLYVLDGISEMTSAVQLLEGSLLKAFLEPLEEHFGFVLIDNPPVLEVSDSLLCSSAVDGVILVVRGGSTPTSDVKKAISKLESVGANVLGVLLNGQSDST
jgi:capsular exopolysaccharide synthesis family protein